MSQNMIAAQKLFLTADKSELVADGDRRAAFLYAVPGDEIVPEMAAKFGLVDGALPEKKAKAEKKPAAAAETKPAATATETKA